MIENKLIINFGIDLVAILIFTGGFFYRRHRRRDLFVTFTFFNIAMFIIVTLITHANIGIGASFGLFALLGIIRLRSEEFSNYEIGYFFGCLTLAMINALGKGNYALLLFMNGVILLSIGILDHPGIIQKVRHSKISLDAVYTDDEQIVNVLEKLLDAKVLQFNVTSINNVRDTTSVSVDYKKNDKFHDSTFTARTGR